MEIVVGAAVVAVVAFVYALTREGREERRRKGKSVDHFVGGAVRNFWVGNLIVAGLIAYFATAWRGENLLDIPHPILLGLVPLAIWVTGGIVDRDLLRIPGKIVCACVAILGYVGVCSQDF